MDRHLKWYALSFQLPIIFVQSYAFDSISVAISIDCEKKNENESYFSRKLLTVKQSTLLLVWLVSLQHSNYFPFFELIESSELTTKSGSNLVIADGKIGLTTKKSAKRVDIFSTDSVPSNWIATATILVHQP